MPSGDEEVAPPALREDSQLWQGTRHEDPSRRGNLRHSNIKPPCVTLGGEGGGPWDLQAFKTDLQRNLNLGRHLKAGKDREELGVLNVEVREGAVVPGGGHQLTGPVRTRRRIFSGSGWPLNNAALNCVGPFIFGCF